MAARILTGLLASAALAVTALACASPALAETAPPTKAARAVTAVPPPPDPKSRQGISEEQRSALTPVIGGYRYSQAARIWASADGTTIYLVGEIDADTYKTFGEVLNAAPKARTLYLSSPGGIVISSYWIGALARTRKLDTWVEHECVSACTQIFAAGVRRLLGPRGRLGFHQTYAENALTGETIGTDYSNKADLDVLLNRDARYKGPNAADQMMVISLRWAGVPDSFLTRVMQTPPEKTWNPDQSELISAGMVTSATGGNLGLNLPPGSVSYETTEAMLLRQRFWQVLKQRDPVRYGAAVLEVWRESNGGVEPADSARNALGNALLAVRPVLARAPAAPLERLLPLLAALGQRERFNGFPDCTGRPVQRQNLNSAGQERALQALADASAALLELPPATAPLEPAAALKQLDQDPALRTIDNVDFVEAGSTFRTGCRMIYQHDEAVQQLTGERRLRLARAWLSVDLDID